MPIGVIPADFRGVALPLTLLVLVMSLMVFYVTLVVLSAWVIHMGPLGSLVLAIEDT